MVISLFVVDTCPGSLTFPSEEAGRGIEVARWIELRRKTRCYTITSSARYVQVVV